ncbi:MAG TPA: hypothetical protein VG265_08755 [Gaiellaceae bacterium]|nr:hypothetical protein [Gaiellaceae bacterium]
MSPTRRQVLAGAAATALGASGVYELVDQLAGSPPKRRPVTDGLPEQHLLQGVRVVTENNVEILVPPLHHEVVTAKLSLGAADLKDAQRTLEDTFLGLESDYAVTPAGLGTTVAWGLPYFKRLVPAAAAAHLPHDARAGKPALIEARTFPSDPTGTVLEQNDLAILLRSDSRAHIDDALGRLQKTGLLHVTSLRRGFAGGAFDGGDSLPRQMAVAANVPGADLIPERSELFLGFTSTQKAAFGPGKIANFETLGYVDLRGGYFREGTHMHLSHVTEDLEAWYINFEFDERVATAFRPNLEVAANTQVVPQGPEQASDAAEVRRQFAASGRIGHSASIQTTSRLSAAAVGADGTHYPKGTAIPIRADFNTLDNPFAYSSEPDVLQEGPAAGIHFLVFNPSSDDFERNRLAMDGILPGGSIDLQPRGRAQGFNSILETTHRQNYLVPPRRHRSFPLAEL